MGDFSEKYKRSIFITVIFLFSNRLWKGDSESSTEKIRIHKKKKQTKYREQDEKKVNVYLKKLSEAGSGREIIYIDETGFDEYYYREYGWSKRGISIEGKKRGFRYSRINLVAGKVGNTLIGYDIQGNNGK